MCTTVAKKKVMLFSCSGAANVAEIADRVARQLAAEGLGQMYCLAALGAGIPHMVEDAWAADLCIVIDGCPKDCARLIFEKLGLRNTKLLRVTDHGIEKRTGKEVTEEQVQKIVSVTKDLLAAA
jgi:uncharacterized metal-binding protein